MGWYRRWRQPGLGVVPPVAGAFALYEAEGLTTANWFDSSGNARHLEVTGADGTLGDLDGLPTLIPGSPMACPSTDWTVGNPATIFLIVRAPPNFTNAHTAFDAGSGAANAGRIFGRHLAATATWQFGAVTTINDGAIVASAYYGLIVQIRNTLIDNAYVNDFTTPVVTGSMGNGTMTGITLGASAAGAQLWTGEIVAGAIYASDLGVSDREQMRDHYLSRYPSLPLV